MKGCGRVIGGGGGRGSLRGGDRVGLTVLNRPSKGHG